jgi:predicted DNA-binding transcriptional regulator YafY
VAGTEESALRALAKLEQMLPSRSRHRIETLHEATVAVRTGQPSVDAAVLTAVATAVRARERVRFDYTSHGGEKSRREVEPHRLVSYRGRWYLVGWDGGRGDWRTFRVDRMVPRTPTGPRFVPHPLSDDAAAALVERAASVATWRTRARVRLRAPLEAVRPNLPGVVRVHADGPHACIADVGADDPATLLLYLGLLRVDFEVVEGRELAQHLEGFAARLLRAAGSPPGTEREVDPEA